jgi:hypothetical protein
MSRENATGSRGRGAPSFLVHLAGGNWGRVDEWREDDLDGAL